MHMKGQESLEAAMKAAAVAGDQAALHSLHPQAPALLIASVCCRLAWVGDLATLQCLSSLSPRCPLSTCTLAAAVEGGHLDTAAWLLQPGCLCEEQVYHAAACRDEIQMLGLLREHCGLAGWGAPRAICCSSWLPNRAQPICWPGCWRMRQGAVQHLDSGCFWSLAMYETAVHGHLQILQSLIAAEKLELSCIAACLRRASSAGHSDFQLDS